MKKLIQIAALIVAGFIAAISPAHAGVPCSVPFNLTNGTIADATQVMANYNAILSCLSTSAAANGVNSDITALTGMTTPLAPSEGGSINWVGSTSTGSANSQVVATTPASFTKSFGYSVTFVPGFSNTGPLQLNVNGTGLTNAYRNTATGVQPMAGGEVQAGAATRFFYDGTEFVQDIPVSNAIPVGVTFDFMGNSVPVGYLIEDGSCVSQTTYANLFAYLGTIWGSSCSAGLFNLPDLRGVMLTAWDAQGVNGAAGINDCGGVGNACGAEYRTITQGNLPNVNFNVTIGSGQGSHTHQVGAMSTGGSPTPGGGSGFSVQTLTTTAATLPSLSGTAASGGSGNQLKVISPTAIVLKAIKY